MIYKILNIVNFIIIVISILFAISCKSKKDNEKEISLEFIADNNLGNKLVLPDSLYLYKPFTGYFADSTEISNAKLKIYSHVDVSCATCVANIKLWDSLIPELNKYKVPVILICTSNDKFNLFQHICESNKVEKFSFPFFLDKKKEYMKLNRFMNENFHLETVLTDKDNTILLFGNPIYSKNLKNLYITEIEKKLN